MVLSLFASLAAHAGRSGAKPAVGPWAPGWEAQSDEVKQAELFRLIEASHYDFLPDLSSAGLGGGRNLFDKIRNALRLLHLRELGRAFDAPGDVREFEEGGKFLHPLGTVAKIELRPLGGHPYTGLFQRDPGDSTPVKGLARLSLGGPTAFNPGIGLKLLVSGNKSADTHAMHNLEGEPHREFFKPPLSTDIPHPTSVPLRVIGFVFSHVRSKGVRVDPFHRPVNGMASVTRTGKRVEKPVVPFALSFVAHPGIPFDAMQSDPRAQQAVIPSGTLLYRVFAHATKGDQGVPVWDMVTTSRFVASRFGDKSLFFAHENEPVSTQSERRARASGTARDRNLSPRRLARPPR